MLVKTIDSATCKRWLDNGEAVLVDVREPAEHAAENIEDAILLPLGNVSKAALPPYGSKKLVMHCRKGARGSSACEKLLTEDPNLDVYNLDGGIEAWKASGLTVISSGKFFLPLDRQVQLTIGSCVVISSILGYFVSPKFLLLTGFLGGGLIFAGLTGSCGLALLMSRMPWNR